MRRRPPDQGKGARGGKASAARVVESAFPTRRRPASHLPLQLPRADAAGLLASGSFRDGRDSLRAAWCKAEAERPPLPRPARREPAGGTWHWGCPLSAAFRARRSSACARRSQRCRRSPSPPSLAVPTPASSCAHEPRPPPPPFAPLSAPRRARTRKNRRLERRGAPSQFAGPLRRSTRRRFASQGETRASHLPSHRCNRVRRCPCAQRSSESEARSHCLHPLRARRARFRS